MKKWIRVFRLYGKMAYLSVLITFLLVFLMACPTSTPTSDQQARAVVSFFQTAASDCLVAGRTFEAAQPQYQSLDPALVTSISLFNQQLALIENQGAAGQSISPTTILTNLQTVFTSPNGILLLLTQWGSATIPGSTGPTQAQQVLLAFLALQAAVQTVDTIYAVVSNNLPTWSQLQAQNILLQTQLTGSSPSPSKFSPLYLKRSRK